MSENVSNIDDILTTQHLKKPVEIETKPIEPQKETVQEVPLQPIVENKAIETENKSDLSTDTYGNEQSSNSLQLDEYGNERQPPKTYTEDEVNIRINEAIRDRLSRLERNGQQGPSQQQIQQQVQQGFEYDSESPDNWEKQLSQFIKKTVTQMGQEEVYQAQQMRRQQEQADFQTKFKSGMSRFNDFVDVVQKQPITDYMAEALEGITDPTAFIYAASKRAPQELERISRLPSKASQMIEMGKLEERMKQSKSTTRAPKPIEPTKGDVAVPYKSDRQPSIEELIAQDAARRLEVQKRRRG